MYLPVVDASKLWDPKLWDLKESEKKKQNNGDRALCWQTYP